MDNSELKRVWVIDQLAKSEFFHQKVHAWGLIEVCDAIEALHGDELVWETEDLHISASAWNRVIHRGIKPVTVYAHPSVLQSIPRSTGYYRMLALVSQKSMNRVQLSTKRFEDGAFPNAETAYALARHLNAIISALIESDDAIDGREFDLWRGMAAGSQAQGAWQNTKGSKAEAIVRGLLIKRLGEHYSIGKLIANDRLITLPDGRIVEFADEPDIAIYAGGIPLAAAEIKGGIDTAAVLERIGAAIKSLRRIKDANSDAVTVIIVQEASLTQQAERDLLANKEIVNYWMTIEEILSSGARREALFTILSI